MHSTKRGRIVIISSPSGGGKTSICRRLLTPARRRAGWTFSVSCTTRQRRPGERNGREYHFVDQAEFDRMTKLGYFAEHFRVHQYNYGTPRGPLEKVRQKGGVIILDVDIQGAFKLKKEYADAIMIFVLPPSVPELKKRLRQRGTETDQQRRIRFERALQEMRAFSKFDYVVVNQELEVAARQVLSIIEAHPCRIDSVNVEQIRSIIGLA
jgi:guanylate kinase